MAFLNILSKKHPTLRPSLEAMPEVAPDTVGISTAAAERILKEGLLLLRVGLQGGGCSGLKPYFAFEQSPRETDRIFTEHGVSVCVDPKSLSLIGGSWLDFENGFKIRSTRLKKSCSCGASFSL